MANINLCIFTGRIGQDPELKKAPGGDSVCRINVAVSKSWKDRQTNEWKQETQWVTMVYWGNVADYVADKAKKGMQCSVSGAFQTRKYIDKNGQEKVAVEFKGATFESFGSNQDSNYSGGQYQQPSAQAQPQQQPSAGGYDYDTPF